MITTAYDGTALSAGYYTTVAGSGRTFRVRFYLNGALLSGGIVSATFYRGACGEEPYAGAVFVPYMDAEVKGVTSSLEGETIEAQIGLLTDRSNDTWEWVKAGTYIVSKPEVSNSTTHFRAVGTLSTIGAGTATITQTAYTDIITEIETATGISIVAQGITVTGSTFETLEGTWRDVLNIVARDLGGFLTEDVDGNWVIGAYCSGSTVSVAANRSQTPPQYDENTYTLNGNTVESGTVDMSMGNPLLDPWDMVQVTDTSGNTHLVPCLQITHTVDGGLSTLISAEVNTAVETTATVLGPVSSTMQYFWVDGDGAHVTDIPKDQFLSSPSGGNVLIDSTGLYVRTGTTDRAKFQSTSAQIGADNATHATVNSTGLHIYDSSGTETANFQSTLAQIGKWAGNHIIIDTSNGLSLYSNGSNLVGRLNASNQVSYLDLYNKNYYVSGRVGGVTIGAYGTNDNTNAQVQLIAYGTGGQVQFHVADTDAIGFTGANLGPNGLHVEGYVETSGEVYVGSKMDPGALIDTSGNEKIKGYLTLATNNKAISFTDTGGNVRSMIYIQGNDYFGLGYGMYQAGVGETRIYGTTLRLYSSNPIITNTQLSSFYKVTDVSKSISGIAAHSYESGISFSMTAQSGYNAVGVIGWSSTNYRIYPFRVEVTSNTNITASLSNATAAASADFTMHFYVLWLKATSG